MDPVFSKALVDTTMPRPDASQRLTSRPRSSPRLRRRLAATLHRWADHREAPAPNPAPCS
jgi:hypothetical protein